MASKHVFPGGIQEETDGDPLWRRRIFTAGETERELDLPLDENMKSRVTAIRELFEESNLLLASKIDGGLADHTEVSQWRGRVQTDSSLFLKMIEALDLFLRVDSLHRWSRWVTPSFEKYRYDTTFFFTVIDDERAGKALQDESETVGLDWMFPIEALKANQRKEIGLAPPTWVTALELANYRNLDHLLGCLPEKSETVVTQEPHVLPNEDGFTLVLSDDPFHPNSEGKERSGKLHRAIVSRNGEITYHVDGKVFISSKL